MGDVGGRYPPLPSRGRRGEVGKNRGHVWATAHRLVTPV